MYRVILTLEEKRSLFPAVTRVTGCQTGPETPRHRCVETCLSQGFSGNATARHFFQKLLHILQWFHRLQGVCIYFLRQTQTSPLTSALPSSLTTCHTPAHAPSTLAADTTRTHLLWTEAYNPPKCIC